MANEIISPYSTTHAVNLLDRSLMSKRDMMVYGRFYRPDSRVRKNSRHCQIDIITGSQKILPVLDVTDPSTVIAGDSIETLTVTLPRLSPVKPIPIDEEILDRRLPGTDDHGQIEDAIARAQKAGLQRLHKTRCYMGIQGLKGVISMPGADGVVREVARWNLPDDHVIQHEEAARLWSANTSKPVQDVRDLKNTIVYATQGGVEEWIAIPGANVLSALETHPDITGDGGTASLKRIAKKLMVDEVIDYQDYYLDPVSNTKTRIVGENEFRLVGWAPEYFGEVYVDARMLIQQYSALRRMQGLTVSETDIPMAEMNGMSIFSDIDVQWDPRVANVRVEEYCLPCIFAPGCTGIIRPMVTV